MQIKDNDVEDRKEEEEEEDEEEEEEEIIPFVKNEEIEYLMQMDSDKWIDAIIKDIEYDNDLVPSYTIEIIMGGKGKEKNTIGERIRHLSKEKKISLSILQFESRQKRNKIRGHKRLLGAVTSNQDSADDATINSIDLFGNTIAYSQGNQGGKIYEHVGLVPEVRVLGHPRAMEGNPTVVFYYILTNLCVELSSSRQWAAFAYEACGVRSRHQYFYGTVQPGAASLDLLRFERVALCSIHIYLCLTFSAPVLVSVERLMHHTKSVCQRTRARQRRKRLAMRLDCSSGEEGK